MKMGTGPLLKGLMVALVALVVLVPVQMLRGLIEERARLRQEAVASVARGWGGEQLVGGPILAIPVTRAGRHSRADGRDRLVRAAGVADARVRAESTGRAAKAWRVRGAGVRRERARRSHVQHRVPHCGAHAIAVGRGRASRSGSPRRAGVRTRAACATSA